MDEKLDHYGHQHLHLDMTHTNEGATHSVQPFKPKPNEISPNTPVFGTPAPVIVPATSPGTQTPK
jgi:hypothetical protein